MAAVSVRAERAVDTLPYYFERAGAANQDAWSQTNPDGFINASFAENAVAAPMMLDRIRQYHAATPIEHEALRYPSSATGIPPLINAVCALLQSTTMSHLSVAPENLVLSSGVASVLENLFFLIQDDGTSCALPAPYYPMYDVDLKVKANVTCVPVHLNLDDVAGGLEAVRRAQDGARCPMHSLLVTSPDNPTGNVLSRDSVKALIRWCHRRRVHFVMNEIYAQTMLPQEEAYTSAISIALDVADELPVEETERFWQHVHIVFGFSKDFCGSGLRVGGLYTHNAKLIEAYRGLAHLSMIPTPVQLMMAEILSDVPFVEAFLSSSATALQANAAAVMDALDDMQIPHVKPQGGLFVWMNLGQKLQIDTFDRERQLWHGFFDKAKVVLVPGETCHAPKPGFFRLCFAAMPFEAVSDMMARLRHFIDQYKVTTQKQSWDTQGYMLLTGFGRK